jgi:hypothetical protein
MGDIIAEVPTQAQVVDKFRGALYTTREQNCLDLVIAGQDRPMQGYLRRGHHHIVGIVLDE